MKRLTILLATATVALAGVSASFAQASPTTQAPAAGKKHGTIAERVLALVLEQFGEKAYEAKAESRFIQDLSGDRLDIVEIVMAAEDEFGITVSDAELGRIETVGDLTDVVRLHVAERRGK